VVSRDLHWEGCLNVRDLGGLPHPGGETAFGAVVRADNPGRLTESGWRAATGYGIRTVVDLRSDPERGEDPPPRPGLHYTRLSLFEHFDDNPAYHDEFAARVVGRSVADRYLALYLEALELDTARFAQAFRAIAHAPAGGVLIHCAGGKDRTGVLSALLLRLVEVPVELVEADYVHSERRLGVVDSAPAGVVTRALAGLEARHGSAAGYFRHVGASTDEIERVRTRLDARSN
jgi:protein-tyrosine phosphatase